MVGTPEEFVSSPRLVAHADLVAMRSGRGLSNSDNRSAVASMARRASGIILESALGGQAEASIVLDMASKYGDRKTLGLQGEKVIANKYAPQIAATAIAFEWGEDSLPLQVLAARLYQHEVGLSAQAKTDMSARAMLTQLQADIDAKIKGYLATHPVDASIDMDLLATYFTERIDKSSKDLLGKQLRERRFSDFFALLRRKKEEREQGE